MSVELKNEQDGQLKPNFKILERGLTFQQAVEKAKSDSSIKIKCIEEYNILLAINDEREDYLKFVEGKLRWLGEGQHGQDFIYIDRYSHCNECIEPYFIVEMEWAIIEIDEHIVYSKEPMEVESDKGILF